MEIFSFFQNLQLFSFGQNLTQGSQENQENQVTSPGVFESFMAEFKSQEGLEGQEGLGEQARQPEVLFAAVATPKVVRPEVRNLRSFRPVNISNETPDLPEKVEAKTETSDSVSASSASTSWKNLFSDTRRVSDVPVSSSLTKKPDVPDDVDFDDGVVADYSDSAEPETVKTQPERKVFPDSVPESKEPELAETPEPVVNEYPKITEPREVSRTVETMKPEVSEPAVSEPEPLPAAVDDGEKVTEPTVQPERPEQPELFPETERAEKFEAEPKLNEPKKIEQPDSDVPEIKTETLPETQRPEIPSEEPESHQEELHQEASKPLERPQSETVRETVEKVPDEIEVEDDVKEIPQKPREVRESVNTSLEDDVKDDGEVRQPQKVTAHSEAMQENHEEASEVSEPRKIPEVQAADRVVIRNTEKTEEPERSDKPERPEESEKPEEDVKPAEAPEVPEIPEATEAAVVMAGFSAVQNTPQAPAAPDVPAREAPEVSRPSRSETPRNTSRATRVSQEVKQEDPEQFKPETQTQSQTTRTVQVQNEDSREESPKPQVSQQKNSVDEAPVKDGKETSVPAESARTSRATGTTAAKTETRKTDVHNDFQSFFDGITRTRRTSTASTARVNTQPLSLRTSTYTEQPQGSTLRNGIVNVVRFIRSDGVRKANIIVDPPAIGRISVELTSSSSGVEASIKVASEQIRQILQDQVTQLRDNLLQQGVQVSDFTVDVQQDNSRQGQNSGGGNQQSQYDFTAGYTEDDDTDKEDFRIDLEEGLLYWVA
ncbi:MAG: flagellar hook-length control protein FliK [Synergistaceae bacterium]|nr:flagellar hook-length control protein FliK [Synergistaceae bacterium]